jgi:hypothetical protein
MEELGEKELEAARGRVEVAAPLNRRVGAGLQAQPLDGAKEPERFKPGSPHRRTPTSPSVLQPFAMEPEPDRPRATPPLSTSSPPPSPRRTACIHLHRARRNAKERGCSTGVMSPWKPWTAPPCFLCSRPFRCSSPRRLAAVSRTRGEH